MAESIARKPAVGETIRARIGTRRPVDYVVLAYLADDVIRIARPSRKHPGDFFGGTLAIPLGLIDG